MTPEQPTAPAPGSVTSGGKHEAKRSGPHHTPEEVAKALEEKAGDRECAARISLDGESTLGALLAGSASAEALMLRQAASTIRTLIQERDRAQAEREADVAAIRQGIAAIRRQADEIEQLRLLILGGEDVPGVAMSMTLDEVRRCHRDNLAMTEHRVQATQAEAKALREALERLAYRDAADGWPDDAALIIKAQIGGDPAGPTVADWRRARSALGGGVE